MIAAGAELLEEEEDAYLFFWYGRPQTSSNLIVTSPGCVFICADDVRPTYILHWYFLHTYILYVYTYRKKYEHGNITFGMPSPCQKLPLTLPGNVRLCINKLIRVRVSLFIHNLTLPGKNYCPSMFAVEMLN